MQSVARPKLIARQLMLLLDACLGILASGAAAAGFKEEGIARLNAAMREMVAD